MALSQRRMLLLPEDLAALKSLSPPEVDGQAEIDCRAAVATKKCTWLRQPLKTAERPILETGEEL